MMDKKNTNYIKTPTFYYISHFAKYIKPGSSVSAFKNPDKSVIIILLNQTDKNVEYNLCYKEFVLHDNLDSHAIVTFVVNN